MPEASTLRLRAAGPRTPEKDPRRCALFHPLGSKALAKWELGPGNRLWTLSQASFWLHCYCTGFYQDFFSRISGHRVEQTVRQKFRRVMAEFLIRCWPAGRASRAFEITSGHIRSRLVLARLEADESPMPFKLEMLEGFSQEAIRKRRASRERP